MKSKFFTTSLTGKGLLSLVFVLMGLAAFAQVTTSSITGLVSGADGAGLPGATVVATHTPSGSKYGTVTNVSGRYTLPAVRVGGPFSITVTYTGFEAQTRDGIYTNLGTAANVNFELAEAGKMLGEAAIVAQRNDIFSSNRTGAASTFDNRVLSTAPTIGSRSINSVTKYNPNGNGSSFGGQDSRLNNFTIDGSVFNNGFGLGSDAQAGGRTGSTAISLDAIEELQVNVAPFDVRQSGFIGSGINAVTRSGTNEFSGSAYFNTRNQDFYGSKAAGRDVVVNTFDENVIGLRIGGPIIKDKVFFFVNGEMIAKSEPAHAFVALGSPNTGTVTRVKYQDMVDMQNFMKEKFGYETGPWENYNNENNSAKFLARLDFNLNDDNKLTLRYTHHDSESDQLISNSASAGAGNRRTNTNSMSFQNSGYIIQDNTRSIVADLNTTLSDKIHNNFIIGYDQQIEDRKYKGSLFPTVDILESGTTYMSVGFDPFTPDNKLNYGTFHATDNVSLYLNKHTVTVGANYEYYKSNNNFFPASNGVYIFNSLADFYKAASSPDSVVTLNRFQYRYSALEGGAEPLQVLKVNKFDLYGQDEIQVSKNFKLTVGLRAGLIAFANTAITNNVLLDSTFIDAEGNRNYKINTGEMPDAKILWEPRLGFNWDVTGRKQTQVRGGAGIFTGRPPYVWVSNQIGNNGVLTGFIDQANTSNYKFSTNPGALYTPATPTLPSTFDIAQTDADYKFPQIIKTNLAIDQKLPMGFVASAEFMYNKNLNAVKYFDANYEPANRTFAGPDQRPRFPGSGLTGSSINPAIRVVNNVSRAAVMTNTNEGSYVSATLKLEYPAQKGLYGMLAYTYSRAQDLMSAGSIASGSFTSVRTVNGNNKLELAYADQDMPNRVVGLVGYRLEYGGEFGGATQVSLGYVGQNVGFNSTAGFNTSRYSYAIGGDMNGDGIQNNDLLFVPEKGSDLTWDNLVLTKKDAAGVTFRDTLDATEQAAAFDKFIDQDPYLKDQRGKYTERNGGLFPFIHQLDLSVAQEFYIKIAGKKNRIQVRADILNFGNLVNSDWGVGNVLTSDRPISFSRVTADGTPVYRLATQVINGNPEAIRDSFTKGTSAFDVWAAQIGIRYTFN